MTTPGSQSLVTQWVQRPRTIHWRLYMGLNPKKKPVLEGSFATTLGYIDDQGEKWGDTYVKVVGQHYDDYAHWNDIQSLLPIGGQGTGTITYIPSPFTWRQYKGAAHGVTGLIGEVLVTLFLQRELKLKRNELAHLMDGIKGPDLCLDVESAVFVDLLRRPQNDPAIGQRNNTLAGDLEVSSNWLHPLPLECKSKRQNGGDRSVRDALQQLVAYWHEVKEMAGYGIFAQIDVTPVTMIHLHFLAPQRLEVDNVRKIITNDVAGTTLTALPPNPTYYQFQHYVGGRLLG